MPVTSAALLLHHGRGPLAHVLIAHMGGPFWARKDERAWSIPKGLVEPGEDVAAAARREFTEELGVARAKARACEHPSGAVVYATVPSRMSSSLAASYE